MAKFRPGVGPTVLTLVAVAAFCSLGLWQVSRYHWREADLAAKAARTELPETTVEDAIAAPASHAFRRVVARGKWELQDTIIVGPVERGRELGARVVTPLALAPDGNVHVLVDRGFVPESEIHRFLPPEGSEVTPESADAATVHGLALELALRDAKPGPRESRHTHFSRFNPDRPGVIASINAQMPYELAPVMLQSSETEAGGLPVGDVAKPVSPVDHFGYAMTWFAVGGLSLVAWVEFGRRRGREERG